MPFGRCRPTMPISLDAGVLSRAIFSRGLPGNPVRSSSKLAKREKGIWQRRFWEHVIRDDDDLSRHVDYVHFNPVKHGYVSRACDWAHSSFHRYVARGLLPLDWGGEVRETIGRFGE
jgi:putative transposase